MIDTEACAGLLPAVVAVVKARELPVVMDLSQVEFLPSLAIGMLVQLQKELKKLGHPLVLTCLSQPLRMLLGQMRLQRLMPFTESVKQGVGVVGSAKGPLRSPQQWKAWADKQISIELRGGRPEEETGP